MVEQIMYFMLGAFSAGLLALLFLPLYWRRALRLSRARLELQTPQTLEQMLADRDQLRAEHAVERCKLQERIEGFERARIDDMVERGRYIVQVTALEASVRKLGAEGADLRRDNAELSRAAAEATGERGALVTEVHDAPGLHEPMRVERDQLRRAHDDMCQLAEQRRLWLAAIQAKADGLELRTDDLSRALAERVTELRTSEERAAGLGEERDHLVKDMHALESLVNQAQAEIDADKARIGELEKALATRTAQIEETAVERGRDREALEDEARARRAAEEKLAMLQQQWGDHAKAEAAANAAIQALRAENVTLRTGLAEARAHERVLAPDSPETLELRAAIKQIGEKVARMSGEP